MEEKTKIYEIGYLLSPLIPEEKLEEEILNLRKLIENKESLIISEEKAKMQKLAYPIIKPNFGRVESAYFGWIRFLAKPNILLQIKDSFEKEPLIVRSMIAKIAKEGPAKKLFRKSIKPTVELKSKEKIQPEEIDKKLEELLASSQ
jgi:ribosomal protein S6